MKTSKLGLWLILIFSLIIIVPSIYGEITYGNNNWMWGIIFGGMPWSIYGLGMGFFSTTLAEGIVSIILMFAGYFLNMCILYGIGYGLEKLYKKFSS